MAGLRGIAVLIMAGLLSGALLLAGCGGPTVTVRHRLAGDIHELSGYRLTAGAFAVEGDAPTYGDHARRTLRERLRAMASQGQSSAEVGGVCSIRVEDVRAVRNIRQSGPAGEVTPTTVPSLVRKIDVHVLFTVVDPATGQTLAQAETHATYRSPDDERSRGPSGLCRVDDPRTTPPADMVIREMIDQCVERFVGMVAPRVVERSILLRPMGDPLGRRAVAALSQGQASQAVDWLTQVVAARPGDANARLNLAVAAELAGQLPLANRQYDKANELAGGKDHEAALGAQRTCSLLARRQGCE